MDLWFIMAYVKLHISDVPPDMRTLVKSKSLRHPMVDDCKRDSAIAIAGSSRYLRDLIGLQISSLNRLEQLPI